jgi:hypothetical protein
MRTAVIAAVATAASAVALTCATTAGATFSPCSDQPVKHCTVGDERQYVDSDACGFPIAVDDVFTNDITELVDKRGVTTQLQLHQSEVVTYVAKGVTLRENDRYTIIVDFVDGIPVTAKHVGDLDEIIGPGGPIFHRTGLDEFAVVFDPAGGFYRDGPRIERHGLRDDFEIDEFCAAFG